MAERRELTRGRAASARRQETPGGGGEEEGQGKVSPLDMGRELTVELGRRNRRQAIPLAAIAGVYGLGLASTVLDGPAALAPIGVGVAAAVAGYTLTTRREVTTGGRVYAGLAAATAAGWLALSAVIGPHGWMTWAAWLGGYALAVPYWARHSDSDPDTAAEREQPAPAPTPEPPPEQPDWRTTRWGTYIAKQGGHLPGSRLSGITEFAHGWRATVELGRGQHWREIAAKTREIASVFDLPDGRVLPERIEGDPVHRGRLTVLTHNPLEQVTRWPGPGLDTGRGTFPFAVTADGNTLDLRLWWPGAGACHTLLAGTTGSGKSAALDLILCEVAASDRLYPVIIDGNGGMSIPDWLEHAPAAATTYEQALAQLQWVEQVRQTRSEHLARLSWTDRRGRDRRGVNSIDPTPAMPGIVVVVDEAPNLLKPNDVLLKTLARLSQMGRGCPGRSESSSSRLLSV